MMRKDIIVMNYFQKIMLYWYLRIFGPIRVFDYNRAKEFLRTETQVEAFVIVIPGGPSLYVKEDSRWNCGVVAMRRFSVKHPTRFEPFFVTRYTDFAQMNQRCYVEYYLDENNQIQQKSVFESNFSSP